MAERKLTKRKDEARRVAQPASGSSAPSEVLPENQGTTSVRGTWPSEGEAGRHIPLQAGAEEGTSSPESILQRLERIAAQARQYPDMQFTTLAHLLDVAMLERAFWSLNCESASGVDRVRWTDYKRDLETNLEDLHERLKSKTYFPQPVRRQWIPKSNGKLRPLGLPALEDKVVAKAVALLLEQIYEQDFKDFSYGFRPGRSCHQASHQVRQDLLKLGITCVIDCDISSFFDNLQHDTLLSLLRKRVDDGSLLRLIKLMLEAGIMDGKELVFPEKGSPQGSVISPLLANAYLHEVLDTWFAEVVTAHCTGKVVLVRYADDFIIGCAREEDAERIMKVLPQRFAKFGLEINTEKSKLVNFVRPRRGSGRGPDGKKPGTFCFLGFVYYWGKTFRGGYTIKRKTEGKRIARTCSSIWKWCRAHRHYSLPDQYRTLCAKLRGHYQYYGVRCNSSCLDQVFYAAERAWHYWLRRRGGRQLTWEKFNALLSDYPLPRPRIVQAWV
jgi:group II intron reverse transcriptase/maturase